MIFVDIVGFLSLVCLVLQPLMAAMLLGFFFVLSAKQAPWISSMRAAFAAFLIGLTAMAVHLVVSFHITGDGRAGNEGWFSALLFGAYLAGKVAFLWFLVAAIAGLRDRRWPRFRWPMLLVVGAAGAVGAALPDLNWVVLIQAPMVAAACIGSSCMLWPVRRERTDIGHWTVAGVLAVMGLLWPLYGLGIVVQWWGTATGPFWDFFLGMNSFWDLGLEVMLGVGLVTMMMDGSYQKLLKALRERDALRERVQQDDKLRALGTLVSGVAHEINNPLTAILGFADELAVAEPEDRNTAARIVREQAERCRHIVQRLSVLSQTRKPQRHAVDVRDFVSRVVCGLAPQFKNAGVAIAVGEIARDCVIHAEAAALEQVLTNLLINAMHASPVGGEVTVRVDRGDARLRLVVEDEGPGVPKADRERIFEPFFTTKEADGTGLGLAVARALIVAHGGSIGVAQGDKGARFEVTLPLGDVTGHDDQQPRPNRPGAVVDGTSMLVIDDEPLVRETISRHARAAGWRVVESESAENALDRLIGRRERYDAVACDLRMPGLSGADFYDCLAEQAPELIRRIVFITGDIASEEAARFAERSKAPILAKPFNFPELLGRLRERALADDVG